jgi:predicted nucleic acid-binding protein
VVTYVATSILVAVYAFEDAGPKARNLLAGLTHPVPINDFLWLEMRNAIRRKAPTGQATQRQVEAMLIEVDRNIADGILKFQEIDFSPVFERAEDLSHRFTEKLNSRASDLFHVAIALETGCGAFLTFDREQAKLAKAAGLFRRNTNE